MSGVKNVIRTTSFNPIWEELYFCTEFEGGVRCLICLKKLHKVSKYNVQRHYLTFHVEEYKDLEQEKRITEIARLKADPPIFLAKHHFNPQWEELYFFIGNESHSTCLICLKTLNNNRKYNVQRHYSRYHKDQFGALGKEERLAKLEELRDQYLTATVQTQESEENELLEIKEQICETIKSDKGEFPIQVEHLSSFPIRCHSTWETYFFVEYKGSPKCLICLKTLASPKQFYMKKHYYSRHEEEYSVFSLEERVSEIKSLKVKFIVTELNLDLSQKHNEEDKNVGVLEEGNPKQNVINELNHDVEEVLQVKGVIDEKQLSDEVDLPVQTENCFPTSLTCHPKWESYFFIEFNGLAKCLICLKSLAVRKKYNMQRHYSSLHQEKYSVFNPEERTCEIKRLKAKLIKTFNLNPSTYFNEEYENIGVKEGNTNEKVRYMQKFNSEWEYLYFFVKYNKLPKCLICLKTFTVTKKYSLERHYVNKHHKQYGMLSEIERRATIEMLKNKLFQPTTGQEVNTLGQTSQYGSQECNVKPDVDPMSFVEIKTETVNIKEEPQECETKCFVNTCSPIDIDMKEEVQCGPDCVKSEMQMIIELQDNKIQDLSAVESNNKNSDIQPNADIRPCYPCNICSMKFSCKKSYNKHQRFHKDNEKYKCESCNVTYLNEDELASHMEFHEESDHECEICNKKFTLKWSFLRHMLRHSKQTKKYFKCRNCNQEFDNPSKLKTHSVSHTAPRTHVCDICNKRFSLRNSLNKHRLIHMDDRPYSCNLCGKSFVQKNDFITHKQRHTGIRLFLCEFCGKTFYSRSELMSHLLVHGGQRPYICDICKKSFYTKSSLIDHINIHMGKRPYVCDVCSKSFTRKDNLRIHKMLHQQIRPHVCVFCNKGFAQQRNLRKHLLIH